MTRTPFPVDNATEFLRSDSTDPPVTVIREMRVKPGHEPEFEALMARLITVSGKQPGHLGSTVVRPQLPGHCYRFIYKFDHRSNLEAWHGSALRAELAAPVSALVDSDRFDRYPGLETWFDLPAHSAPPKWKTTLVTWAAIYALVTAMSYAMRAAQLKLPIPVGTLVLTGVIVPLVAYVVGPALGKLFRDWLNAGARPG